MSTRIFLLSPVHCGGERARLLLHEGARFDLARRVRTREGASLGEVFSFLSGLYFHGKLAYALSFARSPAGVAGVMVITSCQGLQPPEIRASVPLLRRYAQVDIDAADARYRGPLMRDAHELAGALRGFPAWEVVLLGSVASSKYAELLIEVFGERVLFPAEFVGRGDMSRGGLLLRCVAEGRELDYIPLLNAVRRGPRPPKLVPQPGILARAGRGARPRPEPP